MTAIYRSGDSLPGSSSSDSASPRSISGTSESSPGQSANRSPGIYGGGAGRRGGLRGSLSIGGTRTVWPRLIWVRRRTLLRVRGIPMRVLNYVTAVANASRHCRGRDSVNV